jgi:hypothetical protein
MRSQAIVQDAPYDWSEIDLSRHSRLTERADRLISTVRVNAAELEEVLADFARASGSAGGLLEHRREPGALVWHLTLEGPDYRASGTVELTLETASCVAIVARPEGRAALRYDAFLGLDGDFAATLKRQFRAAVVSSVLDAASVVTP